MLLSIVLFLVERRLHAWPLQHDGFCRLLQSLASGRMLMSTLSAGYDLAKGSWGRVSVTSSVLTVYVYVTGRLIWLGSALEDYKKKRDA